MTSRGFVYTAESSFLCHRGVRAVFFGKLYSIYSHIIHLLSIYLRGEQEHFTLHKLGGLLYRNLRHIPPWSGLFVAGSGLFVSRSGLLSALLTARVARLPPGILHPRTENITILYITVCDFLLCSVILLAHFFKISQADFYTCNMQPSAFFGMEI